MGQHALVKKIIYRVHKIIRLYTRMFIIRAGDELEVETESMVDNWIGGTMGITMRNYVWLDEIGNYPDRQADRFIAQLWMAKVRK